MSTLALLPGVASHASPRIDNLARRSRWIGRLFILFYLLLPLEGILRKWVVGDLEKIFGFIRDPVLLAIYLVYFFGARFRHRVWITAYVLTASVFLVLSAAQSIYYSLPLIAPILGIRAYILYAPLAFILAECLSENDIRRFLIVSLAISIPIALLVYVQFLSPPEDWINKGTAEAGEHIFLVAAGIVRPYGSFTFVQAQNTFAAMMVAVVVIAWDQRDRFSIPPLLLAPGAIAVMTMGALSGGRTFFGSAILVGGAYVGAGLTSKHIQTGAKRLGFAILLVASFLTVFLFVFPDSFEAMSERQEAAEAVEGSTLGRALGAFTEGVETIGKAPLLGYGIGAGNNGVQQFLGKDGLEFGETEGGRVVNELGPIFGSLTLLARIMATAWLGWRCVRINRAAGDGSALVFFGFSGYLLGYAQITLQNQLLSFCWMGIGLTLAMCRSARKTATVQDR